MSDSWDQIGVGMKVEVPNDDCDLSYPVYWIASVVKVAGMIRLSLGLISCKFVMGYYL